MNKKDLTMRAFLDAFGVVVYLVLFAWSVNHLNQIFGADPGGWLGMVLFLTLFIISACVTGSLVLLKPILLYLDGHPREAVQLFAYTIGFLVILAVVVGFIAYL